MPFGFISDSAFGFAGILIPKADGHTILQKVGGKGSPPIVVFTSSSNPSERERALAAGAKDYVVKPTGLDDFMKAVQGIVERWSGASQPR